MPAFQGAAIQRGRGLGGVLGGFLRNIVLPTVKTVGKSLLRTGARKAAGALSDVARGSTVQAAIMRQMTPNLPRQSLKRKRVSKKSHVTKRRSPRRRQDVFDV